MPPCQFTLSASRQPSRAGDQFTVSMTPPLSPGCTFKVEIDGQPVDTGESAGDFRVVGMGATGAVTLEAGRDGAGGRVCFIVECESPPVGRCGPTRVCLDVPDAPPNGLRQVVLTAALVLTGPLSIIALLALGGCKLICLLAGIFKANCDCEAAKKSLDILYDGWPPWLQDLLDHFWR